MGACCETSKRKETYIDSNAYKQYLNNLEQNFGNDLGLSESGADDWQTVFFFKDFLKLLKQGKLDEITKKLENGIKKN